MGDLGPQWRGLFNWSMSYQDGTKPTDWSSVETDPDKLKWLDGVMKEYMVDFSQRMGEIKSKLEGSTKDSAADAELSESEKLLEELMEIVESIDHARDLHTIGGMSTLIDMMQSKHDSLRWRAAEVCGICCQNHPVVQAAFLDAGALPVVTQLVRAEHDTVALKGLFALSAMLRGHPPALAAFLQDVRGLPLVVAACDRTSRVKRKALELLRHICSAVPAVRHMLVSASSVTSVLSSTLQDDDDGLVSSALGLLAELVEDNPCLKAMRGDASLTTAVHALEKRLSLLTGEDKDAMLEEIECVRGIADAWQSPVSGD